MSTSPTFVVVKYPSLAGINTEGAKTKNILLQQVFLVDGQIKKLGENTPAALMLRQLMKMFETYFSVINQTFETEADDKLKGQAHWATKLIAVFSGFLLNHAEHAKKEAKVKSIVELLKNYKEMMEKQDNMDQAMKQSTTEDWADDNELFDIWNEVASHRAKPSHNAKASSTKPQPSLSPPDEPGVRRCGICRGELRLSDEIDCHMMGCETLFHRSCNTNHHKIATVPAVFNCYTCRRKSRITSRAPNEWEDEIDEDYSRIYRNVNVMECADLFDHPNNVHTYNWRCVVW